MPELIERLWSILSEARQRCLRAAFQTGSKLDLTLARAMVLITEDRRRGSANGITRLADWARTYITRLRSLASRNRATKFRAVVDAIVAAVDGEGAGSVTTTLQAPSPPLRGWEGVPWIVMTYASTLTTIAARKALVPAWNWFDLASAQVARTLCDAHHKANGGAAPDTGTLAHEVVVNILRALRVPQRELRDLVRAVRATPARASASTAPRQWTLNSAATGEGVTARGWQTVITLHEAREAVLAVRGAWAVWSPNVQTVAAQVEDDEQRDELLQVCEILHGLLLMSVESDRCATDSLAQITEHLIKERFDPRLPTDVFLPLLGRGDKVNQLCDAYAARIIDLANSGRRLDIRDERSNLAKDIEDGVAARFPWLDTHGRRSSITAVTVADDVETFRRQVGIDPTTAGNDVRNRSEQVVTDELRRFGMTPGETCNLFDRHRTPNSADS